MSVATLSSPPLVEIVQIHQCLRVEVTELARLITQAYVDVTLRKEARKHFQALKSIYESHSKAEDEIIFPELQARGMSLVACEELDRQHNGQHETFLKLERLLNTWSRDIIAIADELRASIVLHLRREEEEIFPLLEEHFKKHEIGVLVGKIIGDRSGELMEAILKMLERNLSSEIVNQVIIDFSNAAPGSRFNNWLENNRFKEIRIPQMYPDIRIGEEQNAVISFNPKTNNLGCKHYNRGLKIWAPCCNKLYPCSRCHDEIVGGSHLFNTGSPVQAWCMNCAVFQSNPGSKCINCNVNFGSYFCDRCNIWENDPETHIYHCPYCDVCRLGNGLGKDYFHCMRCNTCVSTSMRFHKCVEGSIERECPVCCESLTDSTKPVHYVPCGHLLHRDCFNQYLTHDYRCALCRCSMIDMSPTWNTLSELIAGKYIEPSSNKTTCHDCGMKAANISGPISQLVQTQVVSLQVGERCDSCGSFNTKA